MNKKFLLIFVVAAAAGLVRGVMLVNHRRDEIVFGHSMAYKHGEVARNLYENGRFSIDKQYAKAILEESKKSLIPQLLDFEDLSFTAKDQAEAYFGRMPGYPLLLAFTWKIFGQKRYLYAQVFTACLDVLGALLLFTAASRLLGIWVGFLAGLFYALWPPLVILSFSPGHDAPAAFLNALALYFGVLGIQKNLNPGSAVGSLDSTQNAGTFLCKISRPYHRGYALQILRRTVLGLLRLGPSRPTAESGLKRYWFGAGLALVTGTMFRPEPLLQPLAWWPAALLLLGFKKSLRAAAVMLAVVLAGNFVWGLRNWMAFGRFSFLVPVYGSSLLISMGDVANKWGIPGTDAELAQWVHAKGNNYSMFSKEFNDICLREALKIIKEDPLWYARLVVRRGIKSLTPTFLAVDPGPYEYFERHQGTLWNYCKDYPWAAFLHLGTKLLTFCVWPLTILAFWLYPKDRKALFFVMMMPLYYWLSHIPQHLEYRYLVPGFFPLFIPAAAALVYGGKRCFGRRFY